MTPPNGAVAKVVAALETAGRHVRRQGKSWMAPCPSHDDTNPSLSITAGDNGGAVLHCFGGCKSETVVAALGLTMSDLAPDDGKSREKDPIVATYQYHDESEKLLFEVVRRASKRFTVRRPDGQGGWVWDLKGVRRVPYRLPELLAADPGALVWIVEGEKDVDRLRSEGQVATTNPGGAGKWSKIDASALHGRNVAIIPDNDEAGRAHAGEIAQSLHGKARSVIIVELSNLPEKGDVSDYLDAGQTIDDLIARVEQAEEWKPPVDSEFVSSSLKEGAAGRNEFPKPVPASQLNSTSEMTWLVEGYLAPGVMTLFTGLWKAGKSTFVAHMIRDCSSPGRAVEEPIRALVISEEGPVLWARRRDKLGLTDNVDFLLRPFLGRPSRPEWQAFALYVARLVVERGYALVVVDTFVAFAPVQDENSASQMMEAVAPLQAITRAGAALLLVHHPRKGDATEGQASRGSGALPGFVDVIIELRRYDPENRADTRRTLTTYSRFDESPPERVVELREDGYHIVGTKLEAKQAERLDVIAQLLPREAPGATAAEVWEAWDEQSEVTRPGKATVASDLKHGAEEGLWTRTGTGKKGDPFRHFLSSSGSPLSQKKGNEESDAATDRLDGVAAPPIHLEEDGAYEIGGIHVRARKQGEQWLLLRETDGPLAGWRVEASGALTELFIDDDGSLIPATSSPFHLHQVRPA